MGRNYCVQIILIYVFGPEQFFQFTRPYCNDWSAVKGVFMKIQDFLFWARSKNLEKIDFFAIFRKSPRFWQIPWIRDFYPRDSGFFKSQDLNPRVSECFFISSFFIPEFSRSRETEIGIFSWEVISRQKAIFMGPGFFKARILKFALLSSFLFSYDLNKNLQKL